MGVMVYLSSKLIRIYAFVNVGVANAQKFTLISWTSFDYCWHMNERMAFWYIFVVQGQCSLQSSTSTLIMNNLLD